MKSKNNFGNPPKGFFSKEESKIAVVPVPYDETSTWGKGADKGPEAIISASANMELYDIETDSEPYREGIFTDKPVAEKSSPEKMAEAVYKCVKDHITSGKFTIVLGGEHSVSVGAVKAHAEFYKDFSVLQLDAHADLRDSHEGSKYNHACVMARVREMCPAVQVGIRSMDIAEKKYSNEIFFAHKIYNNKDWVEKVISKLSRNVYITIDLDVFDISLVPATGTPEPGGLLWYNVIYLLQKVIEKRNVVGFDVVELCPNSASHPSDFLAAKLIYKILGYKFGGKKHEQERPSKGRD